MAKLIRGTLDAKNRATLLKQPQGGTGRLRCPKCQGLAIAELDGTGKPVHKCQGCGAVIKSKAF
jgi:hypothetical protein